LNPPDRQNEQVQEEHNQNQQLNRKEKHKIFVGNIPRKFDEKDVRREFEKMEQ